MCAKSYISALNQTCARSKTYFTVNRYKQLKQTLNKLFL